MNRIVIATYDPRWPEMFAAASKEIAAAMGDNLLELHHIGSTSIPGLCAKPVIDILAIVRRIERVEESNAAMHRLGYEAMGEFGIPTRRYFRRSNSASVRTHQVHSFETGSSHVRRHLAFRDFLRAHPAMAQQYGALKRSLAAAHPYDMDAYLDGKDAFIQTTQAKALEWLDHLDRAGA